MPAQRGRYLLPDLSRASNAVVVRAVGYERQRRTFQRKTLGSDWMCFGPNCRRPTFTDALDFWLHQIR